MREMDSGKAPLNLDALGAQEFADEVNFVDPIVRQAEASYRREVEDAQDENFAEFDDMNFWEEEGVDKKGRQIVRIVAKYFPPVEHLDLVLMRRFIFRKVHDLIALNTDFVILYIHTESSSERTPSTMWMRSLYECIPYICKLRLKAVYILHPALRMRMMLWGLGSWFSAG
eukprot:TRINITY_DN1105_c0_g1_i2.p1 TRINITY_DN1105_c0_g1~~TRINITY_DN1105_c0_g1_i2.p1  ORF type:complete len:171 (+),score=48.11 TRINITY_DN1105_c0_g1_i2:283-795(+)